MRAPLSKLAKEILDNPESTRQLNKWLDSGRATGTINTLGPDGHVKQITATRLNTIVATHGEEPIKRHWLIKIKDRLADLVNLLVNPFS